MPTINEFLDQIDWTKFGIAHGCFIRIVDPSDRFGCCPLQKWTERNTLYLAEAMARGLSYADCTRIINAADNFKAEFDLRNEMLKRMKQSET